MISGTTGFKSWITGGIGLTNGYTGMNLSPFNLRFFFYLFSNKAPRVSYDSKGQETVLWMLNDYDLLSMQWNILFKKRL